MIWTNVTHWHRSAVNLAIHLPGDLVLIGAARGSIVPSAHAKVKMWSVTGENRELIGGWQGGR